MISASRQGLLAACWCSRRTKFRGETELGIQPFSAWMVRNRFVSHTPVECSTSVSDAWSIFDGHHVSACRQSETPIPTVPPEHNHYRAPDSGRPDFNRQSDFVFNPASFAGEPTSDEVVVGIMRAFTSARIPSAGGRGSRTRTPLLPREWSLLPREECCRGLSLTSQMTTTRTLRAAPAASTVCDSRVAENAESTPRNTQNSNRM